MMRHSRPKTGTPKRTWLRVAAYAMIGASLGLPIGAAVWLWVLQGQIFIWTWMGVILAPMILFGLLGAVFGDDVLDAKRWAVAILLTTVALPAAGLFMLHVRSYWVNDGAFCLMLGWRCGASSKAGEVRFNCEPTGVPRHVCVLRVYPPQRHTSPYSLSGLLRFRLGRPPFRPEVVELVVPHWFLVLVALVPPGLLAWWRHTRVIPGKCQSCGYDLRSIKDRCPECGTPIAASSEG